MDSSVFRAALRGLRGNALKAQRKRDPKLMIAIGLADPETAEAVEAEEPMLEDEPPPLSLEEDEEEEEGY